MHSSGFTSYAPVASRNLSDPLGVSVRDSIRSAAFAASAASKRAQARGVRFGRKPKLNRHQVAEALARKAAGEPLTEIGRSYNVSHSTISRLA
jgi:Helix-turn-helix domain of resolvase